MSDISVKTRNYPTAFAKPEDVSKLLASYLVQQPKDTEFIAPPKKNWPFRFGGVSGIPLYYSAEEKKVYVDHTDRHTAVFGPTASKKSRLVAMPTVRLLGAAGESMIISDPKAEIYQRTATHLREIGYEVKVLNLREPQCGIAWNPLSVPYQFFKAGNIDQAYEFANDIVANSIKGMINSIKTEKNVRVIDIEISNIEDGDLTGSQITLKTNGHDVEINKFTSGILKETVYGAISSLKIDDEIRKITVRVEE